VRAVIEDHYDRWIGHGAGAVDLDILGTDQTDLLAELFEAFCIRELGELAVGGLFYAASAGCVLGVELESGDVVVIKAYQRRWRKPFLGAVQEAQQLLAAGGIPCPSPVLPPAEIRPPCPNLAVVETWVADPGMRPGGSAAARRVSAAGLARQIALCLTLPDLNGSRAIRCTPRMMRFTERHTARCLTSSGQEPGPSGSMTSLAERRECATGIRALSWSHTRTGQRATCASMRTGS